MQLRLFTLAALLTVVAPVLGTTASQSCTKALSDSVKGDLVKIQACTEALSKEFNDATAESLASTAQVCFLNSPLRSALADILSSRRA